GSCEPLLIVGLRHEILRDRAHRGNEVVGAIERQRIAKNGVTLRLRKSTLRRSRTDARQRERDHESQTDGAHRVLLKTRPTRRASKTGPAYTVTVAARTRT